MTSTENTGLLRPPALGAGDRVAVTAASGAPRAEDLEKGVAALESLGLIVDVLPSARAAGVPFDYLAGDDATRAADLTTALTDPRYRAVFMARGGYGAQRTLEGVDFASLGTPRPRVLVGYSDVTALIEAVSVHLGWVSLFGPMPVSDDFSAGSYAFDSLARTLFTPAEATRLSFPAARTLVGGTAEGVTLGGTASLLCSSLATPTSRPARGGILFLEDVDEEPYRLDRILTQLRRSGYLDGVAGILCGTFTGCGDPAEIDALLIDRLGDLGAPVLAGADIGHGVPMQTFPVGVPARLDADGGTLTFDGPVLA
ncbi:S66 peptidase family protein [Streptomyces sp. NRRL B-24720]|uniref:S66 peptidase family protein n=1 Tax=Streptomyces sp. NRRL B-24720 TaxID=1476876 RepID=UPI0004CBEC8C|nr:LD-carboxypeptidase [Streptomyces sp. NRRL B-24720]